MLLTIKRINTIVPLKIAGVSVYHSVEVLKQTPYQYSWLGPVDLSSSDSIKWTKSSYPIFPSALLVNFLGTCYVSFKIFNRRSVFLRELEEYDMVGGEGWEEENQPLRKFYLQSCMSMHGFHT